MLRNNANAGPQLALLGLQGEVIVYPGSFQALFLTSAHLQNSTHISATSIKHDRSCWGQQIKTVVTAPDGLQSLIGFINSLILGQKYKRFANANIEEAASQNKDRLGMRIDDTNLYHLQRAKPKENKSPKSIAGRNYFFGVNNPLQRFHIETKKLGAAISWEILPRSRSQHRGYLVLFCSSITDRVAGHWTGCPGHWLRAARVVVVFGQCFPSDSLTSGDSVWSLESD